DPRPDRDPALRPRLEERADRRAAEKLVEDRDAHAFENVEHFGIRADPTAHQRDEAGALILDVLEVRVDAGDRAVAWREPVGDIDELRDQLVGGLAQPGDVEVALRREVVIEQAFRDLRLLRELVDRHLVVRVRGERFAAHREQLASPLVVIEPDQPALARRTFDYPLGTEPRHHPETYLVRAPDTTTILEGVSTV